MIKINELIKENKKEEITFPILLEGTNSGTVWLFISDNSGVCVKAGGIYLVGEINHCLHSVNNPLWKKYNKSVVLSNI